MKYLIVSDIHGGSVETKFIVNKFKEEKCDYIICLGDVLYHGPRNDLPESYNPKKVIPLLNDLASKIICIKGNCDAEVDQMVLEFPILREACVEIDGINYYLTHGHVHNLENPINVNDGVVLYGHTHISNISSIGTVYYINPGSISIPKGNMINSYGIIDSRKVSIVDLLNDETIDSVQL